MPYCTRCGREIKEGERCTCQQQNNIPNFNWKMPNGQGTDVNSFLRHVFGLADPIGDPRNKYEHDVPIVPDCVTPDEGEKTICQYDLCRLRSRIKGMQAEGRLQVTNKRIIFRAKGTSLTGPTILQKEFAIAELSGFSIAKNFRFSWIDLLLILVLSFVCGNCMFRGSAALYYSPLLFLAYLVGLAALLASALFLGKHHGFKACLCSLATAGMHVAVTPLALSGNPFLRLVGFLLYLPVLLAGVICLVNIFLFSFKGNLDFNAQTRMGSEVMHLRCEPTGFAGLNPMIRSTFTGYNEVLPARDTDRAIEEIGAIVSDIQKLGDYAIEKWKRD